MIEVNQVAAALESWAPLPLAETYDNVGLLVGLPEQQTHGVLINLDMTEAVVEEAIELGLNMVVAHHPIWFGSRKRLNGEDYVSRTIMKAVKHDIALYAIHTNLDNIRTGVNQKISDTLGLQETRFLQEKPASSPDHPAGSGMVGTLAQPMEKQAFLQLVKERFHCGGIRYADGLTKAMVQKVAVCGGAGSFLTKAAIQAEADAFVTADITYHKFFDHEHQLLLMDIGHYESEQFTSQLIHSYLSEKFPNFAVHLSKIRTNPIQYC
ncbi:MAG: Nif3-like dinuclear metal center hexameric protein [Bacteroidota bacterium]